MNLSRKDVIAELWRRGSLGWMLRDYQRDMREAAAESGQRVFFSLCSRRTGKTHVAVIDAHEGAIKGGVHRICLPTLMQAEDVVGTITEQVLATCPETLRPKFNAKHLAWEYPNGTVKLAGAETRRAANRMRGANTKRFYLDEACFYDEFEYVLGDIVMPTLLTSDGVAWLSSTPADVHGHPSKAVYEKCRVSGACAEYTIDVLRGHYPEARIDEFLEEAGGKESDTAKREYFCQWIPNKSRIVIPEWVEAEAVCVYEQERPKYCNKWVVGDFGFQDLTVVLFAYVDFEKACVYVEDEVVTEREASMVVADEVRAKELELWGEYAKPARYADAPDQVRADMYAHNKLSWMLPPKTDSDAALNALRVAIQKGHVAIHPRCKVLISHLRNAIWNSSKTSFDRMDGFGHFDGVDALKYLVRVADRRANPSPDVPDGVTHDTHYIPPSRGARRGVLAAFGR